MRLFQTMRRMIFDAYNAFTRGSNDIRAMVPMGFVKFLHGERANIIRALRAFLIGGEYYSPYAPKQT